MRGERNYMVYIPLGRGRWLIPPWNFSNWRLWPGWWVASAW